MEGRDGSASHESVGSGRVGWVETVRAEQLRFFDGGTPGEPPRRDEPPRIVLERRARGDEEVFALLRRVGYADRHLGELLVPADPARFTTDLTSVPSVLTWLVPRSGRHLPAALVHDALVADPDRAGSGEAGAASYVSEREVVVDRVEADRVFRDAMADTGTGVVRRWLAWSAVTLVTLWVAPPRPRGWYRVVPFATLLLVVWLGWCATWDLLDTSAPLAPGVPWIAEGGWSAELLGGAAGAVVVPLLLAPLWGRFARAGAVLGVGLAALLHVTVVLAVLTLAYQALERLVTRHSTLAARAGATLVLACAVVVGLALVG